MRCGELCKSCFGVCREIVSETTPIDVQCPTCEGNGCQSCDGGVFTVSTCPSRFIGRDLLNDIRVATSSDNWMPVAGGLLDQSAWWFELREAIKREELRVQEEQAKRRSS